MNACDRFSLGVFHYCSLVVCVVGACAGGSGDIGVAQ